MKKFTIILAALLSVSLVLVGCGDPEAGAAGTPGSMGTPGSVPFSGDVTAAELAKAFAKSDEVILQSTVTSVYGAIPAGKTLAVFGKTAVKAGESLDVTGALEIETSAALDASYVGGTAGYLKGTAANVTGAGTVKLPYVADGIELPDGGIGYTDVAGVTKTVGSYITTATPTPGSALDNADIAAIFALDDGPAALTASGIAGLTAAAVPAGKTLTLTGTNNTFAAALDLATGGTLIVDGTLTDSTGVAIWFFESGGRLFERGIWLF